MNMDIISLIAVTVLATLVSGALVGFLIYLGVVVSRLKRTTKTQSKTIKDLQDSISCVSDEAHRKIDTLEVDITRKIDDDTNMQINQNFDDLSKMIDDVSKKVDSRYDKLSDKTEEDVEHLREIVRGVLGKKDK